MYCGFQTKEACEASKFTGSELSTIRQIMSQPLASMHPGGRRCQWNAHKGGCRVKRSAYVQFPQLIQYLNMVKNYIDFCPTVV